MKQNMYSYAKKRIITLELVQNFYNFEKELASRLRNSTKEEREQLYTFLYDELFKRVPFHPQITTKVTPEVSASNTLSPMQLLGRFLNPSSTFLEVELEDCSVSLEVAKYVK
ncbi:putative methyltransferase [Kalymmatonema gypsitolerans NIES-4073]|nr:putative methyltransferase [Scytonema sp. NIES-4073]